MTALYLVPASVGFTWSLALTLACVATYALWFALETPAGRRIVGALVVAGTIAALASRTLEAAYYVCPDWAWWMCWI